FVVRDQALVITTPEDEQAQFRTVAYAVDDLLAVDEGVDLAVLEKLVCSTIDPGSWQVYGGPALIHQVDDRWLIVQQTQGVGDQVAALFETLRQMLAMEEQSQAQSIDRANEAVRKRILAA